jgi:hypothetical protein
VERTWRFGLPLVLAFVEGGFQAIAILGFVAPLACSLAGPAVGRMLDSVYRPLGLGAMLALQDGAIALSSLALIAVARSGASGPLASSPLFGLLVVLAMLEKLASISSELAIERDWVTQLAGKQNQGALARSNAYLRRTDLVTELVGAVVFGWIYSKAGLVSSMAFTAVLAALAAPLQLFFINRIAHLAPSAMLHGRQEPGAAWAPLPSWRSFVENARLRRVHAAEEAARRAPLLARLQQQAAHALDGWRSYFAQPILPSSLTCVLLFFNVVLSPGGLITAFLTSRGFDGNAMAAFRGGCATCGFLGTIVGKRLIQSLGLLRAGAAALLIQATLLFGATVLYTTLLSVPASLGAGAAGGVGLLLGAGAAAAWPTVGGIALPVVLFAGVLGVRAGFVSCWTLHMAAHVSICASFPAAAHLHLQPCWWPPASLRHACRSNLLFHRAAPTLYLSPQPWWWPPASGCGAATCLPPMAASSPYFVALSTFLYSPGGGLTYRGVELRHGQLPAVPADGGAPRNRIRLLGGDGAVQLLRALHAGHCGGVCRPRILPPPCLRLVRSGGVRQPAVPQLGSACAAHRGPGHCIRGCAVGLRLLRLPGCSTLAKSTALAVHPWPCSSPAPFNSFSPLSP